MDLGLRDRVVMVVGANGGIGTAVAHAFAAEGCRLALATRTADRAAPLVDALCAQPGVEVAAFGCDLGDATAPEHCVGEVESHFGAVDVLAMCAGNPTRGRIVELTEDDWARTIQAKLLGSVRLTRAVLPGMRARRFGRVVLVGGLNGRSPTPGGLVGGVTGAGLANFARGVAQEVASDGVTVNVVDPHYTRTARWDKLVAGVQQREGLTAALAEARAAEHLPIRRPIEASEVADLIVFLASLRAAAITGTAVPIDGGMPRGLY